MSVRELKESDRRARLPERIPPRSLTVKSTVLMTIPAMVIFTWFHRSGTIYPVSPLFPSFFAILGNPWYTMKGTVMPKSVLIINCDEYATQKIDEYLKILGFATTIAKNGQLGIAALRTPKPDSSFSRPTFGTRTRRCSSSARTGCSTSRRCRSSCSRGTAKDIQVKSSGQKGDRRRRDDTGRARDPAEKDPSSHEGGRADR